MACLSVVLCTGWVCCVGRQVRLCDCDPIIQTEASNTAYVLSTLATIVAEFGNYSRQCGQGFSDVVVRASRELVINRLRVQLPAVHCWV